MSDDRDNLEYLYEQVAEELESKQIKKGVMARAYSESNGDQNKADAKYITYRIQQLQNTSPKAVEIIEDPDSCVAPNSNSIKNNSQPSFGVPLTFLYLNLKYLSPMFGFLFLIGSYGKISKDYGHADLMSEMNTYYFWLWVLFAYISVWSIAAANRLKKDRSHDTITGLISFCWIDLVLINGLAPPILALMIFTNKNNYINLAMVNDIGRIILLVIIFSGWTLYLKKSDRVKKLFPVTIRPKI